MRCRFLYFFTGIFLISFSVLLSSCKSNDVYETVYTEPIQRDDYVDGSITGTLQHVQYYNKHDKWDFRTLSIELKYGEDKYYLSMYDSFIEFECNPIIPADNVKKVEITKCYFTDYRNQKHEISGRSFSVKIVDYPYSDSLSDYAMMILPFLLVFASMMIVIIFSLKPTRILIHD